MPLSRPKQTDNKSKRTATSNTQEFKITSADNPNITYSINPNVTYSINPNVTTTLNPNIGKWKGYYVCTPESELIGASVIANEDVMVIYTGKNWIGHFVTNRKGGYNFF